MKEGGRSNGGGKMGRRERTHVFFVWCVEDAVLRWGERVCVQWHLPRVDPFRPTSAQRLEPYKAFLHT